MVARTGLDVPVAGLTAQEAARRLTTDGPNELQTERSRNLLQEAWDVICQPMIFVDGVCRHGRCGLDLSGAQGRAGACRAAGSVLAEGAGGPRWAQVRIAGREVVLGDAYATCVSSTSWQCARWTLAVMRECPIAAEGPRYQGEPVHA